MEDNYDYPKFIKLFKRLSYKLRRKLKIPSDRINWNQTITNLRKVVRYGLTILEELREGHWKSCIGPYKMVSYRLQKKAQRNNWKQLLSEIIWIWNVQLFITHLFRYIFREHCFHFLVHLICFHAMYVIQQCTENYQKTRLGR